MTTTISQDQGFLNDVIGTSILESAIDWIQRNLNPQDVFSERYLQEWAEDNDYIKSTE